MSRGIRLLTIYILLDFCNNALGQIDSEASVADISVEIDGFKEGEREDGDDDGKMKLMGLDYYTGQAVASRENDYDFTSSGETQQLKSSNKEDNIIILDSMDTRNYKAEIQAGNKADILGINPHYDQPDLYPDFSRRFVLQYPYKEVKNKKKDEIKTLTPKFAPPELVLAVAEKSALLDASAPKDHNVEIVRKDILRTGDYWNAVWKEDVDPKVLRTKHEKKLETIKAEIPPGSTLYDLVSKLKHISPTLLYVINDKES